MYSVWHHLTVPASVVAGIVALLLVPSAAAAPSGVGGDDRAAPAVLTVTATPIPGVPRVPAAIAGANQRWLRNANGALKDGAINERIVTLARRIGLYGIRYPGGQVGNTFDFRRFSATDPAERCQTSGGGQYEMFDAIPDTLSTYSVDLSAEFVHRIGGRTILALPLANTTPARAEKLVRAVKAASGQAILYVEFGNEPQFLDERYWMSPDVPTRLRQYIEGGEQLQGVDAGFYAANQGLFKTTGCDLLHPQTADGTPHQRYRPRFPPISLSGTPPRIVVGGDAWTYAQDLAQKGPAAHVFTLNSARTVVRFGDGTHGAMPSGAMRIHYRSGPQPGFVDMYRRLSTIDGVRVCSAWGRMDFVRAMGSRPYDCLAVHSYAYAVGGEPEDPIGVYGWLVGQGAALAQQLQDLRQAMRAAPAPGAGARVLAVTEFGAMYLTLEQLNSRFLYDLYLTQLLIGQVKAGVVMSNMPNFDLMFVKVGRTDTLSSRAHVVALFSSLAGQQPMRVTADTAAGVRTLATRAGQVTRLLVVNERIAEAATYQPLLRIQEQPGGDRCVTVRKMHAGLADLNVPTTVDGLPPAASISALRWDEGTQLRPVFESHSLTLLTIRPRTGATCTPPRQW